MKPVCEKECSCMHDTLRWAAEPSDGIRWWYIECTDCRCEWKSPTKTSNQLYHRSVEQPPDPTPLPCPFCGSAPFVLGAAAIECRNSACPGQVIVSGLDIRDAIAKWNAALRSQQA